MTRRLLAFGRRVPSERRLLDVDDVVETTAVLLRPYMGEDVTVELALASAGACVSADVVELEQALLNLATNSRDAMPTGGTLTIATRCVELSGEQAATLSIAPGAYVALTVRDTGTGMSAEVKAHALEPFFTTKDVHKGSGLGLATVYGTVRKLGGDLVLASEPGRGTEVTLYVPRRQGPAAPSDVPRSEVAGKLEGVRVLFVEDERLIRMTVDYYLRQLKCVAAQAASAEEGLTRLTEFSPHVILTDMVMPQMSGAEFARHARAILPGVSIVYMSAFSTEFLVREGRVSADEQPVLQKPFTKEDLAESLTAALGRSRGVPNQNETSSR
jgi:CheY-like chemotaxis protein